MKVALLVLGAVLHLHAPASHPHHYLVLELDERGAITPRFHTVVSLDSPRASRDEAEIGRLLSETARDVELVTVRVEDDQGREVFRDAVEVPRFLRTEFASTGERQIVQRAERTRAFVVRVPVANASRLALSSTDRERGTLRGEETISLDALSRALKPLPGGVRIPDGVSSTLTGSPANRVDVLVIGDGYTAAQQTKFNTDAANLLATFLSVSPYSEYLGFVNTQSAFFASAQSGADHPPYNASCPNPPACCSDTDALGDPKSGTFVSTAFDATFCDFNVHRLLTVNTAGVLAAAAALPNWDKILVLVNDTTYGGSGGSVSTSSTNASAVGVAQHEYGHQFTLLADEYDSPYPGFPACSDITAPPCEANVTNQTTRALIKWAPWISAQTPIPTPAGQGAVGLFEGARYLSAGMYRPKNDCLMRSLGVAFCEVCKQAYVKRLYSGGWGTPSTGVRSIEPGSESPAPGAVSLGFPGSRSFTVSLLSPTTPALTVTWLVNGVPVVTGITTTSTSTSLDYTPPVAGTYTIELRAKDNTSLVQPTLAAAGQESIRNWTLNATAGGCCLPGDADGSSVRNINDVVLLASAIVGNVQYGVAPFLASKPTMNLNPALGTDVDVLDLVILMNFIVGNILVIPL